MKKEMKKSSVNWNKIVGWYVIILSLLTSILIAYILIKWIIEWAGRNFYMGADGTGYFFLAFFITILIFFAFMIFLGFKIKKGLKWAKITALVIFIFLAIPIDISFNVLRTTEMILSVVGIILIFLSLKSK